LPAIVERARRMFDVGANPAVIAKQLGGKALLKRPLHAHPGIRTTGAWDPFELSVRAILGQQISVAAATTIAAPHRLPQHAQPKPLDALREDHWSSSFCVSRPRETMRKDRPSGPRSLSAVTGSKVQTLNRNRTD